MKKYFRRKNRIIKRAVSFMLVWVLLLTELPLNLVSDDVDEILEDAGLAHSDRLFPQNRMKSGEDHNIRSCKFVVNLVGFFPADIENLIA